MKTYSPKAKPRRCPGCGAQEMELMFRGTCGLASASFSIEQSTLSNESAKLKTGTAFAGLRHSPSRIYETSHCCHRAF